MYNVIVDETFDAAHHLVGYNGKCAQLHGHTYKVSVCYRYEILGRNGFALDFGALKIVLRDIISELDHKDLNSIVHAEHPTAELIAEYIAKMLPQPPYWVEVQETPTCRIRYYPESEEEEQYDSKCTSCSLHSSSKESTTELEHSSSDSTDAT